jgi:hypothetical protein
LGSDAPNVPYGELTELPIVPDELDVDSDTMERISVDAIAVGAFRINDTTVAAPVLLFRNFMLLLRLQSAQVSWQHSRAGNSACPKDSALTAEVAGHDARELARARDAEASAKYSRRGHGFLSAPTPREHSSVSE